MEDQQSDSAYARAVLLRWLPESRPFLAELDENEAETARDLGLPLQEVNVYSLISLGFVWPVLVPAMGGQLQGDDLARRCAALVEELLTCARSEVRQATGIRAVEMIAGTGLWYGFAPHCGPATRRMVLDRRREDAGGAEAPR